MRVHERGHRQPRPVARGRRQLTEQIDHLLGEDAVAHRAAVRLRRAVGLAADPAREPERVEPVGLAIRVDGLGDERAVVVGGHQRLVAARDREVGVADVPLAPVVGLVAAGAEPVAQGRDLIGIEPAHRRVAGLLGHPVGLGHPVQRWVLPREQRGPAGHAGGGTRVVAVELQPPSADRSRAGICSRRNSATSAVSYGGGYRSSSVMITSTLGPSTLLLCSATFGACSRGCGTAIRQLRGPRGPGWRRRASTRLAGRSPGDHGIQPPFTFAGSCPGLGGSREPPPR